MTDVFAAAVELQEFCLAQQWEFCLIGGIAVQRWGEPRVTVDADLTLLTGLFAEEQFVDKLLDRFEPRARDMRDVGLRQRVLLLRADNGTALDVVLGSLPFEVNSVRRATRWIGSGRASPLITCTADDLIVQKAFAARDRDWVDVTGIVMRQGRKLNVEQIWSELRPLVALKGEPEILAKLQGIFDQHLD